MTQTIKIWSWNIQISEFPSGPSNYKDYISIDSAICSGDACIKATRLRCYDILANLSYPHGKTELMEDYDLSEDQINSCILYIQSQISP